jgi:hypothetical protein
LVVVTGVLVALGLNATYERRGDRRAEAEYINLLIRDVNLTIQLLKSQYEFEGLQLRDGITAYKSLSVPSGVINERQASSAIQNLMTRRTLLPRDATYQDLISTGNLRLIRNRTVRDHIIDFFQRTAAAFEVINKNATFFVDELYNGVAIGQGLILPRATMTNLPNLGLVDSALLRQLGSGYTSERDPLWLLPATSSQRQQLKAVLLQRIRIAALAQRAVQERLRDAQQLKSELARR